MVKRRPVIGIPADRRMLGEHPFHAVGEKYIRAVVEAAGALPLLVPALGADIDADEWLASVDGILFTGSPSPDGSFLFIFICRSVQGNVPTVRFSAWFRETGK